MANGVPNYLPGFEPDDVKKLLRSFFGEIDRCFPDKKIVWSEWNHEKLDKPAGYLCKYLGYSRGTDFLNAYGYSVVMEREQEDAPKETSRKKPVSQTENRKKTNPKPTKKKSTGLIVALCLLILCLVGGALFFIPKLTGTGLFDSTPKAATEFDKQIEAVSKLPVVSGSDITYLTNSYNNLSPSEKAEVKNYELYQSILSDYAVEEYNIMVSRVLESQNFEDMLSVYRELKELDPATQNSISGFRELEKSLTGLAYDTILSYKNGKVNEMHELIVEFKDLFSKEQLENAMLNYAKWGGFLKAEDYIKSLLKNPRSYQLYDGSIGGFGGLSYHSDDGTAFANTVSAGGYYEIEYGGTNSFGGSVRDKIKVNATVYFDFDELTVDYAYIGEDRRGIESLIATPTPKK